MIFSHSPFCYLLPVIVKGGCFYAPLSFHSSFFHCSHCLKITMLCKDAIYHSGMRLNSIIPAEIASLIQWYDEALCLLFNLNCAGNHRLIINKNISFNINRYTQVSQITFKVNNLINWYKSCIEFRTICSWLYYILFLSERIKWSLVTHM